MPSGIFSFSIFDLMTFKLLQSKWRSPQSTRHFMVIYLNADQPRRSAAVGILQSLWNMRPQPLPMNDRMTVSQKVSDPHLGWLPAQRQSNETDVFETINGCDDMVTKDKQDGHARRQSIFDSGLWSWGFKEVRVELRQRTKPTWNKTVCAE